MTQPSAIFLVIHSIKKHMFMKMSTFSETLIYIESGAYSTKYESAASLIDETAIKNIITLSNSLCFWIL
jgi:hypothetical protein